MYKKNLYFTPEKQDLLLYNKIKYIYFWLYDDLINP
jgi:hypothetical protein